MIRKVLVIIAVLQVCYAPPVSVKQNEKPESQGLEDYLEYHRYIREVVNALESDPAFREKLEKADEADIRSGKIAQELDLVSHSVRTQLDEIKRTELHRLRELRAQQNMLENNSIDDSMHHHIDHKNLHTFEIEDLKKLISKTTQDLAEADKRRREEFKQYELQKEYEKQDKLNHTTGDNHEKLEKEYQQQEEKHKKHEKLHAPGHKQQLEQVWEEQDHMQQDFDPKTFFMFHDLDSNGLWDQDEVKALFIKELDKMYQSAAPEDDMRERVEEMERMRESVFTEMDMNRDGFIDYQEFLKQTQKQDFNSDPGWQGLDEQKLYTDEELEEYIRRQKLHYDQDNTVYQQNGHPRNGYPSGPVYPPQGHPPPQAHMQPPAYGVPPPGGYPHPQGQVPPAQGQFHPGQLPQVQVNPPHVPNQGYPNLNTNEVYPDRQVNPNHQQQYQQQPNNVQPQVPVSQQLPPNAQQPAQARQHQAQVPNQQQQPAPVNHQSQPANQQQQAAPVNQQQQPQQVNQQPQQINQQPSKSAAPQQQPQH